MLGVCVLLQLQREGPEAHIHTAHCIKAARTSNVIPSVSKKKKKKKVRKPPNFLFLGPQRWHNRPENPADTNTLHITFHHNVTKPLKTSLNREWEKKADFSLGLARKSSIEAKPEHCSSALPKHVKGVRTRFLSIKEPREWPGEVSAHPLNGSKER